MDGSKTPSERTWIIGPSLIPDDRPLSPEELPDQMQLQNALSELGPILERIGGVVSIAVERAPSTIEGVYIPIRYVIRWHSFVPARDAQVAEPPAQNGSSAVEEPVEAPA
jgi:hypothetical protein